MDKHATNNLTGSFAVPLSGLMALGVAGLIALPASGSGGQPASITLTGVVRDFQERAHQDGHPDFEVKPSAGYGLYCGNIDVALGENGNPTFTGNG